MQNLVCLLLKPDGGQIPIGLMGMTNVLLVRVRREHIRAWATRVHGPWDAMCSGGAAEAGWVDELRTECTRLRGSQAAGALMDLTKLYELVSVEDVIGSAEELGYPDGTAGIGSI